VTPTEEHTMRKFVVGGIAIIAGLVPLALVAPSASGTVASKAKPPVKLSGRVNNKGTATATGGTVEIAQSDFGFSPTFVKIPAGTTSLVVTVKNVGQTMHTFTVPSQTIDKVLNPGDSVTVTVNVPKPGAIAFFCRFHKSLGMQGAFFDKKGAKLVGATGATSSGSSGGSKSSGGSSSSGGSGY
jgi:plastocyanin